MKKITFLMALFLCLFAYKGSAQVQIIHSFNGQYDINPFGNVTVIGNTLYGMTQGGNLFSVNKDGGNYKDLHFFKLNLSTPGSLIAIGKKLYGMTTVGGKGGEGNIFSIDTNGNNYKDVYDFSNGMTDFPLGNLIYSSGMFYGTLSNDGKYFYGGIFSIDTNGTHYTELHDFNGTDGERPSAGSLALSGNTLYGMTPNGGANGMGVIFSIQTNGTNFKDLFNFDSASGNMPNGSVIMAGGKLCGMTYWGGRT